MYIIFVYACMLISTAVALVGLVAEKHITKMYVAILTYIL